MFWYLTTTVMMLASWPKYVVGTLGQTTKIELEEPIFVAVISRNSGARLPFKGNLQEAHDMLRVVDVNRSLPNALRQHYNLGTKLGADYKHLIAWNSSKEEFTRIPIVMRSFPFDYYVQQTQAQIAGLMTQAGDVKVEVPSTSNDLLLPPLAEAVQAESSPEFLENYQLSLEGNQSWTEGLPHAVPFTAQPLIPVVTYSRKTSLMFMANPLQQCMGITDENEFEYSHFLTENSKKFTSLSTTLENATPPLESQKLFSKKNWELEDMANLYSLAEAAQQAKGALPAGIDHLTYKKLQLVRGIYLLTAKVSNSAENARVYTNGISRSIIDEMYAWIDRPNQNDVASAERNVIAGYTVDASTMLAFMVTLGLVDHTCYMEKFAKSIVDFSEPTCLPFPDYAATLVFELRKVKGGSDTLKEKFVITAKYNGQNITLPRCKSPDICDCNSFKQMTSTELFLDSIETKCGFAKMSARKYYWMLIVCMVFSSSLLLILTFRIKKKQEEIIRNSNPLDTNDDADRF